MGELSLTTVVGLLLLFPVLVILLGEIALRLRRRGRAYASSVTLLRNVVLPLAVVHILLLTVGGVALDSLVSKLLVTFGVLLTLVAIIGILNGVLFERDAGAGAQVPKLFLDLGRIFVVSIGLAIVLSLVWDVNLGDMAAALGVSSIVIGLALQDTLGNLFNGITLINERPFTVGDFIEVDGYTGRVVEVNWRAIRLLTRERDLIVLPHIKVAQTAVINHSKPERHWAQKLLLGFDYSNPPNLVKKVLYEAAVATHNVLTDPAVEIKVEEFADSAVIYEVEYYIADYGMHEDVRDDYMTRVWYAARRHGLSIPFPQLNIPREPQQQLAREEQASLTAEVRYLARMLDVQAEEEQLLKLAQSMLGGAPEHRRTTVQHQDYGLGEIIINQGLSFPGLYFLLSGEARMTTRDFEGDEVELALLHRGDFFTEVFVRGSRTNAVSVRATEDTEVLYLGEGTIRRLVNRYPALANTIEDGLKTRRRQLDKLGARWQ